MRSALHAGQSVIRDSFPDRSQGQLGDAGEETQAQPCESFGQTESHLRSICTIWSARLLYLCTGRRI